MEKLTRKTTFEKEDYIRLNKAYWNFHSIKFWKSIASYLGISLIFLVLGFLARTEKEPWNPFILLGLVFSCLTLSILYLRIFQKVTYNRKIRSIAKMYDELMLDNEIEFTDECLKYSDSLKQMQFKWEVFSSYAKWKNYLILTSEMSQTTHFMFEKKNESDEEFEKILEFLKIKVKSQNNNTVANTAV